MVGKQRVSDSESLSVGPRVVTKSETRAFGLTGRRLQGSRIASTPVIGMLNEAEAAPVRWPSTVYGVFRRGDVFGRAGCEV